LVAPVLVGALCWLAFRQVAFGRRLVTVIATAMFVVSLWLCVKFTDGDADAKNYSFYLMPLRAWEFIIGGAIPFLASRLKGFAPGVAGTLIGVGFVMILGAILGFDHARPFPSWRALLPAAGAALVIAGGLARPDLSFMRWVAARPILWIGLVSYAWYLWHWPLMAFARIYNFGELPLGWGIGMALLSLL